MKIYTRTGDGGTTGLYSGKRVSKADPRVEAYGTIDELNACLGLLSAEISQRVVTWSKGLAHELLEQQKLLFAVGASLADDRPDSGYEVPSSASTDLEDYIDRMNDELPAMTHFILPGGDLAVSYAHLARTVCRRAERRTVEVDTVDPAVIIYLNRLSDYLFVLSRHLGRLTGAEEIKWLP